MTIAHERADLGATDRRAGDNVFDFLEGARGQASTHRGDSSVTNANDKERRFAVNRPKPSRDCEDQEEEEDIAHAPSNVT